MAATEGVMGPAFAAGGVDLPTPFPRLTYDEAIARFGTDRPDMRFGMEIRDLGDALRGTEFKVFRGVLEGGGVVRGINAGAHELSRAELDRLIEFAQGQGAGGLVWAYVEEGGGWRSPVAKFLSEQELHAVGLRARGCAGRPAPAGRRRGRGRRPDAGRPAAASWRAASGLIAAGEWRPLWVTDFPLVEWNDDEGRWEALHHPFTSPSEESLALLEDNPAAARARAYDVVLNGVELGGGSIRINRPEVQYRVLETLGIGREAADEKFGFLIEALKHGAPPHGGIAFGIDRMAALLAGRESIRDVIAFPKTATGQDPMTGAPAPIDERQLRELGIRVDAPPA